MSSGPDLGINGLVPDAPSADAGSLSRYGLDGWSWRLGPAPGLPAGDWSWSDGLGTSSRRLDGAGDRVLFRSEGVASALVSVEDRSVLIHEAEDDRFGHWMTDQLVPRILSHLGHLAVHGGAVVAEDGQAVLIAAPSGHGKSTLAAFLHRSGWPILGDDATLLRPRNSGVMARAVYPRLKLRTDSWERLYPGESSSVRRAGWKVSVDLASAAAPSQAERGEVPLAAIFCLAPPDDVGPAEARRIDTSPLCMQLVRNSFALDPVSRDKAARRLAGASAVASLVPGFRLSYPRDFTQLPQVRQAIRDTLDALAPPRQGLLPMTEAPGSASA